MIKRILIFILLFQIQSLFSQDTSVTWFKSIDTTDYKINFDKKNIPKECYKIIGIKKVDEIANPNEKYAAGCVALQGEPRIKFNWLAKDKHNHIVISISRGGLANTTHYYYFNTTKGKININELIFRKKLNFSQTVTQIKLKNYRLEDDLRLNNCDE